MIKALIMLVLMALPGEKEALILVAERGAVAITKEDQLRRFR